MDHVHVIKCRDLPFVVPNISVHSASFFYFFFAIAQFVSRPVGPSDQAPESRSSRSTVI